MEMKTLHIPRVTMFGVLALLSGTVHFSSMQAQEKCSWEAAPLAAAKDAERSGMLKELQQTMKREFTFTIGDTAVIGQNLFGATPPSPAELRQQAEQQHKAAAAAAPPTVGTGPLPASFDWGAQGKVSSVKCQWCNDCWAFASAAVMESSMLIGGSPSNINLSEQSIVDCSTAGSCASGGWWGPVFSYASTQGIPDEQHYPYTHTDAASRTVGGPHALVQFWDYVAGDGGDPSIEQMKRAIKEQGPIIVAINATRRFQAYKSGVFNELPNDTSPTNHEM